MTQLDFTSMGSTILGLAAFMLLLFLFLVRPQLQRLRRHEDMIGSLRPGDQVTTNGGLVGIVSTVGDSGLLHIKVADGVTVRVLRSFIHQVESSHSERVS